MNSVQQNPKSPTSKHPEPIWDLPTRIFHWLLVVTVLTAWLSTETLYFETHLFAGYLLILLLLFRMVWGFIGGTYSQFRHFAHPWRGVRDHLLQLRQGIGSTAPGHNPAGGWMIFLLLGTLLLTALTGLLTLGGEEQSGPLAGATSIATGATLHQIHNGLAWFLILLIPLHLAGVVVEQLITKRKLVFAMFSGHHSAIRSTPVGRQIALVSGVLLTTPAFALWFSLATDESTTPLYTAQQWEAAPGYTLWQEECSGCHTLHHPSLLPMRSWNRMMMEAENHFGEDLALELEVSQSIDHFLQTYAAEQANSEASWKISNSIASTDVPLQITATPYWREKHHEIDEAIWRLPSVGSQMHCDGCHQDASAGTFFDRSVALPGV